MRGFGKIGIFLCAVILMGGAVSCSQVEHINAEVVYRTEARLGEGAIWHPDRQSLFWVDIEEKTLYEFLPQKRNCRSWKFDRKISTVVPESEETMVVAL